MESHARGPQLFRFSSLRSGYLAAVALFTFLLTAAALLAFRYAAESREPAPRTTRELRDLRQTLHQLEERIDGYLRTPGDPRARAVRDAVDEGLAQLHAVRDAQPLRAAAPVQEQAEALETELRDLSEQLPAGGRSDTRNRRPEETLAPALSRIRSAAGALEAAVEQADEGVQAVGAQLTGRLALLLWGVALAAVVFIVAAFVVFERRLLAPIALMVRALRAEAAGQNDVLLPEATCEEAGALVEAFALMRRQVQDRQRALESQALYDALTGLPNRVLLRDRLQQVVATAARSDGTLALLFLDLNRFKEVNDTLGHGAGDALLQEFANRLRAQMRASDTVARLAGDEFAILLPGSHADGAVQTAERIGRALDSPVVLGEHSLYMGCSVGIALYPQHAADPESLTRCADVAMYMAKRGRNLYAIYDPKSDHNSVPRLAMGNDLRAALEHDALHLHYQPQLDLATGNIVGVEALLRWTHPQHGPIPPDEFVAVAEQTGLIHALTRWVLTRAVSRFAEWRRNGSALRMLAVNLSVFNLQDPDLARHVGEVLERWNLEPGSLVLEITESAMMADPVRATAVLGDLSALGVQLAVDDFGTGYSSLAYLKRLPVKKLKIDKSFVREMLDSENDAVIVRSTIDLAHNLGLAVVAEGAENATTLNYLTLFGCDLVQGYFISRPMPGEMLEEWLAAQAHERRAPARARLATQGG